MTDLLLDKCIAKFRTMLDVGKDRDDCPQLPQSLVIYRVRAVKHGGVCLPRKALEAWRYENGKIMSVPTDAKAVQTIISQELYREGCACFSISRLRRKAFVSVYFGKNISMGFEYDMHVTKTSFALTNEKVIWE